MNMMIENQTIPSGCNALAWSPPSDESARLARVEMPVAPVTSGLLAMQITTGQKPPLLTPPGQAAASPQQAVTNLQQAWSALQPGEIQRRVDVLLGQRFEAQQQAMVRDSAAEKFAQSVAHTVSRGEAYRDAIKTGSAPATATAHQDFVESEADMRSQWQAYHKLCENQQPLPEQAALVGQADQKALRGSEALLVLYADLADAVGQAGSDDFNKQKILWQGNREVIQRQLAQQAEAQSDLADKQQTMQKGLSTGMSILGIVAGIASLVAAPFTAGASLAGVIGLVTSLGSIGMGLADMVQICRGEPTVSGQLVSPLTEAMSPLLGQLGDSISQILTGLGMNAETASNMGSILGCVTAGLLMLAVSVGSVLLAGKVPIEGMASQLGKLASAALEKILPESMIQAVGVLLSQAGTALQTVRNVGDTVVDNLQAGTGRMTQMLSGPIGDIANALALLYVRHEEQAKSGQGVLGDLLQTCLEQNKRSSPIRSAAMPV